jgi:phosphatidylglycerophosphatase A
MSVWLATAIAGLGGIGRLRPAPGTWGSAAVLPLAWAGPGWCLLAALAFTLAGWLALRALSADAVAADPGWVVVDEAAGQALALAALPAAAGWPGVLLAFLLFRGFDIAKPGPVGWADRRAGPFGVMLDDLLAGALAAGVIGALRALGL